MLTGNDAHRRKGYSPWEDDVAGSSSSSQTPLGTSVLLTFAGPTRLPFRPTRVTPPSSPVLIGIGVMRAEPHPSFRCRGPGVAHDPAQRGFKSWIYEFEQPSEDRADERREGRR